MNIGSLIHRIDIWANDVKFTNELGELEYGPGLKKTIWANIIPQTGSLQKKEANTILSNVTHKIIVRYESANDVTQYMYIMFRGKRFDIKYILNPYFKNESLEIFCEEVIE